MLTICSYTEDQMRAVQIAHREAKNWSDWVALGTVRVLRWGMDFVTGYRHPKPGQEHDAKFRMTEQKWLTRLFSSRAWLACQAWLEGC